MLRTPSVFRAAMILCLVSGSAYADGMAFVARSVAELNTDSSDLVPTAQRALLWYEDEGWTLTIEPKYQGPKGGAAWLIPFPVCPTVAAGEATILSELSQLTNPVFVSGCYQECLCEAESSGFFGCAAAADSGKAGGGRGATELEAPAETVHVWQEGELGALDFAVITGDSGQDIVTWLDSEGYVTVPSMQEFATETSEEGLCYFAAKVERPSDDGSLPVVQFRFDGLEDPFYPLRLTRLGLTRADAFLELTLWIVVPLDEHFGTPAVNVEVKSLTTQRPLCLDETLPGADALKDCLDDFFVASDNPVAAVMFHSTLSQQLEAWADRSQFCEDSLGYVTQDYSGCLPIDKVVSGWTGITSEKLLKARTQDVMVTRLEARLPASAMLQDLQMNMEKAKGLLLSECNSDYDCQGYFTGYMPGGMGTSFHGLCKTSGDKSYCTEYCSTEEDCEEGWSCILLQPGYDISDQMGMYCLPPGEFETTPMSAQLADPFTFTRPWFTSITGDCGFDCPAICNGEASSDAIVYTSQMTPRSSNAWLAALLLLGLVVSLWGLARRRAL